MDYSNIRDIFNFRLRDTTTNTSDADENETSEQVADYGHDNGPALCLLHKNGMLGAAYYSFLEKTLNVYEEMSDIGPHYLMTSTIHREVNPKYLVVLGDLTEEYVMFVINMFNSDTTNTTTSSGVLPPNFFLLSFKEYTYEACKTIVSNINVASNISDPSEMKRELFIQTFVNLNYKLSVQALGALYKFLERHWATWNVDPTAEHFMHINPVTLKNHVLLDLQTFKALRIFSQKAHDAGFKRGQESSCREGFGLYKMFMSSCKSRMGQSQLRDMMLSPINDVNELEKRMNFIQFALEPAHMDFITNIQANIRGFKDPSYLSLILGKIHNARASGKDWHNLYKIIQDTLLINDISRGYKYTTDLLEELNLAITENVVRLHESINNAIDFKAGAKKKRPVIKFGLDNQLDAKMLHQQDLAKHIAAAARMAINDLPEYINECKVVYIPEMGHLIAIKMWEDDCDPEDLRPFNYQLIFCLGNVIHYKNPLCLELDDRLGGINAAIIDHENRILRRLSEFALKYNKDIRDAVKVVAKIDCLIAMAKVCQQNNYVRPELNTNRVFQIIESRHALMEQQFACFEPNDYFSGGIHSTIKIITGPNGSGKTVYLSQILIIIYLAHIGCYVPASEAKVGMVDSIHVIQHSSESAVVKLSSFMMSITQSAQALQYWSANSVIIMDEFGRDTMEEDGLILLCGILKYFLKKKECCPHVLVSTHMQQIANILPESKYLQYMKLEHTFENGTLCCLYKMSEGISKSFAIEMFEGCFGKAAADNARLFLEHARGTASMIPEESRKIQEKYLAEDLDVSAYNIEESDT